MKYAHSVFLNGKFYPRGVEIPHEGSSESRKNDTKKTEKPTEVKEVVADNKEVEVKTPRKSAKRK